MAPGSLFLGNAVCRVYVSHLDFPHNYVFLIKQYPSIPEPFTEFIITSFYLVSEVSADAKSAFFTINSTRALGVEENPQRGSIGNPVQARSYISK